MNDIKTATPRAKTAVFAVLLVVALLAAGAITYLLADHGSDTVLDPVAECGVTEAQFQYDSYEPGGDNGSYSIRHYIVRDDVSLPFGAGNFAGTIEVYSRDGDDKRIDCNLI